MFVTGNSSDYIGRLHSLPASGGDLTSFEIEGISYTGVSGFNLYPAQRIFAQEANIVASVTITGSGTIGLYSYVSGYIDTQFFTGRRYF